MTGPPMKEMHPPLRMSLQELMTMEMHTTLSL